MSGEAEEGMRLKRLWTIRLPAGVLLPVLLLLTLSGCGPAALAAAEATEAKPTGEKVLPVQNIQPPPEPPSGCETTSAAIALRYLGFDVGKTDLLPYFTIGGAPRTVGGKTFGPDPWSCFAGDPKTGGYGCFAPVVADAVNRYFGEVGSSRRAVNVSGTRVSSLTEYIDADLPVIVWATISMREPYEGNGWYLDGSGEYFRWTAQEHCLVLIGYSGDEAVFSDPLDEQGTVRYDFSLFETRYRQLYSQAIVLE